MKSLPQLIAIFIAVLLIHGSVKAATFTVTSILDTGAGTLRNAIISANATSAADIIEFKILPGGPQHILLNSPLPQITNSDLTIDGTTQINYTLYNYPIISIGENLTGTAVFSANGCNTVFKSLDVSYTGTSTLLGKGFYITSNNKACTIENCWIKNRQDGIVINFAGTSPIKIVGNNLTNCGDYNSGGSAIEIGHKDGNIKAFSNTFGGTTWRAIRFEVVSNVTIGATSGDIRVGTSMRDIPEPIKIQGGANITVTDLDLAKTGSQGSYGIHFFNTSGVTVTNCIFKNRFPGLGLKACKNFIRVSCNLFHFNELGIEFDGVVVGTQQKIIDNNFICNIMAVRQFPGAQMLAVANYWNVIGPPPLNGFNGYAGNCDISNFKNIPLACALPSAWLCGTGTTQIWACHNQAGGTTQNQCINLSDVPTHLAHGDSLGKCKPNCCWGNQ